MDINIDFILNNYLRSIKDDIPLNKGYNLLNKGVNLLNNDIKNNDIKNNINLLLNNSFKKHSKISLYKLFYNNLKLLIYKSIVNDYKTIINDNVYYDLEIYSGNNGDEHNSILNSINYTETTFGLIYLQFKLYNPTYSIIKLNISKSINLFFINNPKFSLKIIDYLKTIKTTENYITWLWDNQILSEDFKILNNMAYFDYKYLKPLNKYSSILNIIHTYTIYLSPIIGIVSPLITAIVPYIILRFYYKFNIDIITYIRFFYKIINTSQDGILSLLNTNKFSRYFKYLSTIFTVVFYIYSIYQSIRSAIDTYKVIKTIHIKLHHTYNNIKTGIHIYNITKHLFEKNDLNDNIINDNIINDIEYLLSIKENLNIYNETINNLDNLIDNKGIILTQFKYLTTINDKILSLLTYVGKIDYFMNNYKLNLKGFTQSSYLNNKMPLILFKSIWHPSFSKNKYVKNDSIIINNYLITGPNASGKSSFIKSVGIAVLLSHTIGLTNSGYMIITPFKLINTYLNIPDCKGKESLFQAEMNRCIYYLKNIQSLNKKEYGFNIMDEVFSGTNPTEGISGAYSFLYELSKYNNNLSLVTTHYDYLSNLEKETDKFKNYHFEILKNNIIKNNIHFTYKLKVGKSTMKIALELLNQSCFNKNMINKSLEIYKKLHYNKVFL